MGQIKVFARRETLERHGTALSDVIHRFFPRDALRSNSRVDV